jgi:prepilin-type N-terminal cleavage/methylation domain-containing protein
MCHSSHKAGFTLIELLATITIMAVLATMAVFFTASYMTWAKKESDHQTLVVLNDALTRYKCEGGGVTSLTHGANIGRVLGNLQSAITFANHGHVVLQAGVTYPSRSLSELGDLGQYHFTRYNTYALSDYTSGGSGGSAYGAGVGYMANDGSTDYNFGIGTSTGYIAIKDSSGNVSVQDGSGNGNYVVGITPSFTFWSCVGGGGGTDPTPGGTVEWIDCNSNDYGIINLTSLNVSGLTGLTSLNGGSNSLTSLSVSGLASLQSLDCSYNALTSLLLSGCASLEVISCGGNQLKSLDISGLPACYITRDAARHQSECHAGHLFCDRRLVAGRNEVYQSDHGGHAARGGVPSGCLQ